MGRKKKRNRPVIFCYYCDRLFESERVLIQHQRAKHFKCSRCNKRISSARGMMVHMFQVHKETVEAVPGAKPGRDSFDMEIFGMDGVPIEIIAQKRAKVLGEVGSKKLKNNSGRQVITSGHAPEIMIPGTPSVYNQLGSMHPYQQQGIMVPGMLGTASLGHMYGFSSHGQSLPMSLPPPPVALPPPPQVLTGDVGTPVSSPQQPMKNSSPEILAKQLEKKAPSGSVVELGIQGSSHVIIPQLSSGSQPFGGYATPQMGMRLPLPAQTAIKTHQKVNNMSATFERRNILVYDNDDISQEEQRAIYPKYSTHLSKRIVSLSSSIEERLKSLGGEGQQG